jgi:hypothetical protein
MRIIEIVVTNEVSVRYLSMSKNVFFFNKCLNIKNNILHSIILNLFENYSMQIKNNTQVEYIKAKSEN